MAASLFTLQKDVERRLDSIGWGLFFLMSGAMLLVPGLPDGSWLAGVGLLLIGLAIARSMLGLPVNAFGVIVAIVLVASGAGTIAGVAVPWLSLLLVLCGVALVVGEIVPRLRQA